MSELTVFRDHARKMAVASHVRECGTWTGGWQGNGRHRPDPACSECVTESERGLWASLADEVDEYLAAQAGPMEDLFGGSSVEPVEVPD